MVSAEIFHGGAFELSFGVDTALPFSELNRVWRCTPTASGLTLTLPTLDDGSVPSGTDVLLIMNFTSTTFTVADVDSIGLSFSVAAFKALKLSVLDAASGAGSPTSDRKWMGKIKTPLT